MGSKDYMEMKFAFLKELVIFCVRALTDTLYKLRPNYTGRKATEGYVAPNGYGFRVILGCGPPKWQVPISALLSRPDSKDSNASV